MVDTTDLGIAALAYVNKDVVAKLLNPSAEYLGERLKESIRENLERIVANAERKRVNKSGVRGQIPPKVLKTIINEGAYSNDEVAGEYFGGVLASSTTEIDRDDRGDRLAKLIGNMSVYQLRSHYLIYSTISELFSNSGHSFDLSDNRAKMEFFMSFQDYTNAMEFTQQEWSNGQILHHVLHGLDADGLVEHTWRFGDQESLKERFSGVPSAGIICGPSALGAELLLWAFGYGDKGLNFLLTSDFAGEIKNIPKSVPNAVAVKGIVKTSS